MEKRQRQFDKALEEWKKRVAEQQTETERWQKECRNHVAETYRVKAQVDEAQQTVEALRKDNKNLNGQRTTSLRRSQDFLWNWKCTFFLEKLTTFFVVVLNIQVKTAILTK